jgi:hypothetical protein
MTEPTLDQVSPTVLDLTLLQRVAAENIDAIPDDLSDLARFVIGCIRAAARRADLETMCAFVYSEAAGPETASFGFSRIAHMQDGHGVLAGSLVVSNRDVNNGMRRECATAEPSAIMDELESLGFADRCAVIWDPEERVATIYPTGVAHPDDHTRNLVAISEGDLTQDDVCVALDKAYDENLCNPSGHTAKLWVKGAIIGRAEDELERHIKGQLTMFFAGRERRIKILPQTNMTAGRADLLFLQRSTGDGPRAVGVLELKVLRGPAGKDHDSAKEGLSQGYFYRKDLELPFATLALFDVADPPSNDVGALLVDQIPEHVAEVRVKRYPLYDSPKAWRDAGGVEAAA